MSAALDPATALTLDGVPAGAFATLMGEVADWRDRKLLAALTDSSPNEDAFERALRGAADRARLLLSSMSQAQQSVLLARLGRLLYLAGVDSARLFADSCVSWEPRD